MKKSLSPLSSQQLSHAVEIESQEFEKTYRWLEKQMPLSFLEEVQPELRLLIARYLLGYRLENRFSQILLPEMAIILIQDSPDADLKIVKHFSNSVIRHYRTFTSKEPPPGDKINLRIAVVYFKECSEKLSAEQKKELSSLIRKRNPEIDAKELHELLDALTNRFIRSMSQEGLKIALDLFFRAKKREQCQYEIKKIEDWEKKGEASLELILSWRNVPKRGFLYRIAQIIYNHGLILQKIIAIDIDPYGPDNAMILSLALHGKKKAAWEEADIEDLLKEIALSKYFETEDLVQSTFVHSKLLTGNEAHLVRNFIAFVHQILLYADPNLFSFEHVSMDLCRHPELTVKLCKAFEIKFHPEKKDPAHFQTLISELIDLIGKVDTGQPLNDLRRKSVLLQTVNFIQHLLKTNFYRQNKSAFSFRLDPRYLDGTPFNREEKFPELPFAIFFIRGMHFLGFNIRFKDLARGGVRTVIPEKMESYFIERNNIFAEAYNLAYTQQKKNKDIPEGGAKTAILLKPLEIFAQEEAGYRQELELQGEKDLEEKLKAYRIQKRQLYLFASQRSFIESLMTLINCDEKGILRAKSVVDYWEKPEYIYLGPDENMLNEMIIWIAAYATKCGYKPGRSFMSSKPGAGINHKEYGVTSFGVHVYLQQALLYLGINPEKEDFTLKISGGPDGDVAGNEILNLYKFYPKHAKLIALTDISGTIYDPKGLNLKEMVHLFQKGQSIRFYPTEKLNEGGFLLDLQTKRDQNAFVQQTLCVRKKGGKLIQDWLSGNEMNQLYRSNVHQVKTDVFITGGGRPRTLNESNVQAFLDEQGKPTARAIVEGANLYLTPEARHILESLGTLVFKDSSCNKGGVICSSFEVLASLCMSEEEFLQEKQRFVEEVLAIIGQAALNEARLLLKTHQKTKRPLSDISDQISERINLFKYQLLEHFENLYLSKKSDDFLVECLIRYCPPLLREKYHKQILALPDIHKKAIIACYIGSRLVYHRGVEWIPSIGDILPTLAGDPAIL